MQHLHTLITSECAGYLANGPCGRRHFCLHRDGECRLHLDRPGRCRYLEEAVLPADEQGSARAEYAMAFNDSSWPSVARYAKRAVCACCRSEFRAAHNRDMYCSEACREAARRIQVKEAVRRHRKPKPEPLPV